MIKMMQMDVQNIAKNLTIMNKQHALHANHIVNLPVVDAVLSACMVVPQEAECTFNSPNSAMANEMGMQVYGDNMGQSPSPESQMPPVDDSDLPQPAIKTIKIGSPHGAYLTPTNRQYPANH